MPALAPSLDLAAEIAKPFEDLRLEPYHDPVGFPTYGYGHLLSRTPWADLSQWEPLPDEAAADHLLEQDMLKALASVRRLIAVPLTDEQEAALVDFSFNCGAGNLQVSTLRRVVNRYEFQSVPRELMRWTHARGRRLAGLVRRRQAEVDLWMAGTTGLLLRAA